MYIKSKVINNVDIFHTKNYVHHEKLEDIYMSEIV